MDDAALPKYRIKHNHVYKNGWNYQYSDAQSVSIFYSYINIGDIIMVLSSSYCMLNFIIRPLLSVYNVLSTLFSDKLIILFVFSPIWYKIDMAILKGMCNSGQTMYSRILNKSLKSLLEVMISDQQSSLAHIHIPELPVFNQSETNGMRRVPIKYNTKSM
jgi:hypothetical protein